jgi:hypothetical protein
MYLRWAVAPDRDVVIAVDRPPGGGAPAARVIDPWAMPGMLATSELAMLTAGLPAGVVPRALHAADLDGDGAPELVAAFAARAGAASPPGSVRVCKMTGAAPARCDDVLDAVHGAEAGLGVTACFDAAPGRLSARDRDAAPTATADVAVLCRDAGATTSLFRVSYGKGGAAHAELLARGVGLRAIRTGDVTGDGVDDIVALQGDSGSQTLVVYRQCTSRDAEGCRAAAQAAGGAP